MMPKLTDTITDWHVLSAMWPEVQPRLAELATAIDGRPHEGVFLMPPFTPPASTSAASKPKLPRPPLGGILGALGRELVADEAAHPIIGRDREINELLAILLKYFKPNAVLIGDAGVFPRGAVLAAGYLNDSDKGLGAFRFREKDLWKYKLCKISFKL